MESIVILSAGITFATVSIYESLDFISIFHKMKEDSKGRLFVGILTGILAGFFFLIGNWFPEAKSPDCTEKKEESSKGEQQVNPLKSRDIIMTVAGNLIGYALILIMVSPMKYIFKKWRKEVKKEEKKEIKKKEDKIETKEKNEEQKEEF